MKVILRVEEENNLIKRIAAGIEENNNIVSVDSGQKSYLTDNLKLKDIDAVVFLFTSRIIRFEEPQDNILFDYGYLAGTLGKDKLITLRGPINIKNIMATINKIEAALQKISKLYQSKNTLSSSERPYLISHKEIIYEYLSITEMRHVKKFDIKMKANGVNYFEDRYKWTGSGTCPLEPLYNDHEILHNPKTDDEWDYYFIKLPRSYKIGEIVRTGIKMTKLDDSLKKAKTFLSTGIYEDTDKLTLRLIFPCKLLLDKIELLEYTNYIVDAPNEVIAGHYDKSHRRIIWDDKNAENNIKSITIRNTREIRWEINNPKVGGKYTMRWNFGDTYNVTR